MCYLDFKGAFPSTDHKQLVRTLEYLGLPRDFTLLVSNLYSGATTEFVTPHGRTLPVEIGRGTAAAKLAVRSFDTLPPYNKLRVDIGEVAPRPQHWVMYTATPPSLGISLATLHISATTPRAWWTIPEEERF